jgi:hypothetical protein
MSDYNSPYAPQPAPTPATDQLLSELTSLTRKMEREDEEIPPPPSLSTTLNLTGEFLEKPMGDDDGLTDYVLKQKVPIISFSSTTMMSAFCFGHVGTLKNSFCLKPKNACKYFKHGGLHATSAFVPSPNTYYICKPRPKDTAWCQFAIDEATLHQIHPESEETDTMLPVEQWKALFQVGLNRGTKSPLQDLSKEQIQKEVKFYSTVPNVSDLKTPSKKKQALTQKVKQEYEKEHERAIEFLTLAEQATWDSTVPTELTTHVENITDIVTLLLDQVKIIHAELEERAQVSDISSDITDILSSVKGLKSSIGVNMEQLFPDLWSAVSELNNLSKPAAFDLVSSKVSAVEVEQQIMTGHFKVNAERWKNLLENWLPVVARQNLTIKKLQASLVELLNSTPKNLNPRLASSTLDEFLKSPPTESIDLTATAALEARHDAEISELKATVFELQRQLNELDGPRENHQPMDAWDGNSRSKFGVSGVRFRNFYFQDPKDLQKWLKHHLSVPCHGLFVDLVSFSEFFGGDRYIERNTTLNDLYLTNKIGYATMADSIVATSFQNVLPGAYGRHPTASGSGTSGGNTNIDVDAQTGLPGLPTVDKWDKRDGSTGRKYWIKREARNTYYQIDTMIRNQLGGPVQILAKDLLSDSLSMSETLFAFISNSYDDTMHSNRFDSSQAWNMTCKFVKRIFSELADIRVIARDGITIDDPWATSAKFIFTTLKAHTIMAEFMRLNIKDHPSISSEMVKFVCYSQPATDTAEVLGRLTNVESLQRGDQSSISRLEGRLKKVETWKQDTEKTVKKLVDKHGL